jgi:hypothetical protein
MAVFPDSEMGDVFDEPAIMELDPKKSSIRRNSPA